MDIQTDKRGNSTVAIIKSQEVLIQNAQDALDLMATVRHQYDCGKMILPKSSVVESFFDLKSGLAGEILQKFANYYMKVAIIGDFGTYTSKSLKDFIYESNKGNQVFFLAEEKDAIEKLHNALQ